MIELFSGLKTLIILDDIDNEAQFEALVSPFEACQLKDGSHLVITSRDEQIVIWAKVQRKLYMEGLSETHANLLFNYHAFLRPEEPPEELKALAKEAVKACQGLPLALEALSAQLFNKDVALWKETMKVFKGRHRMSAYSQSVTLILKISHDGLCTQEKLMCLDVTCIMLGQREGRAKRIWCELGLASVSLDNLRLKSLVKVDQDRRLTMHDLLQDMGRAIVEDSHPNIWQRSHLWDQTDVQDVLQRRKGASEVREVRLALGEQGNWSTESFAGMDSLRFLVLTGKDNITVDFGLFPKELRWLQWHKCPWERLPCDLDLSKVAVLDLLWDIAMQRSTRQFGRRSWPPEHLHLDGHMFENLRELVFRSCLLKKVPDFSVCCKELEVQDLLNCFDLKRVPESIGCLSSTLTHLHLTKCSTLTTLPDALVRLHSLKSLKLDECYHLTRLPDAIGKLTALEEIGLRFLHSLEILPQSLGDLTKLSTLDLYNSAELQELPSTVGNLRKLTYLGVSLSGVREIPVAVCSLTNLVGLSADGCQDLVRLPEEIGNLRNLQELELGGCIKLSHFPSGIGTLRDLQGLDLSWCNLEEGELPKEPCGMSILRYLDLHLLTGLQSLYLVGCNDLREIPQLPSSLEDFRTDGCKNLREVRMFPPSLRRWTTAKCPSLMMLPSLYPRDGIAHLELLDANGCTGLPNDAIEEFAGLTSLRMLNLSGTGVPLGRWIKKLVSLEELMLDGESLPQCFIRYKPQVGYELGSRFGHIKEVDIEVRVPHTRKGMECKGLVLCVATSSSCVLHGLTICAPGEIVEQEQQLLQFVAPTDARSSILQVRIFRACLKGGTVLITAEFNMHEITDEVVPKVGVRVVHEDHEFEVIRSELALAGVVAAGRRQAGEGCLN